jgi:hypothetical protein
MMRIPGAKGFNESLRPRASVQSADNFSAGLRNASQIPVLHEICVVIRSSRGSSGVTRRGRGHAVHARHGRHGPSIAWSVPRLEDVMKKICGLVLAFLAAALPLSAKELVKPDPDKAALAAPIVRTIPGNPLQINVGSDQSYQVFNSAVPGAGQFYPETAPDTASSGWFVRVDGVLFAPNFNEHPGPSSATGGLGQYTPFTETSISPLSGTGTSVDPYVVTVSTAIGSSGLTARKRISYVNGENFYREQFRIINSLPTPRQVAVFLGSDIYLANSDRGRGFREQISGAVGGVTCPGEPDYKILHIPLTPADRYVGTTYSEVWQQIGSGELTNVVETFDCSDFRSDNGAALQWNLQIGGNGAATVQAATSFGDVPAITGFNIFNVTPAQAGLGAMVTVDITGVGFQPATTFDFGVGITVSNVLIINGGSARADLAIGQEAPFGFRDVIATQSPGGLTATLIEGFAVLEPPVFNYMVSPAFLSPIVYNCIRNKFPGNPQTNLPGWAPDEGDFYYEIAPGIQGGPRGLALAILECYIPLWNTNLGGLFQGYCWEEPTPTYFGQYPTSRFAHFRIFHAVNFVCTTPPPGTSVFESTVLMDRIQYFKPPLTRSGFEEM